MANDEKLWQEVLQRLVKIEENTKGLDDVAKKAQDAYAMSCANKDDISELKDAQKSNRNWLMTIIAGIIGYVITTYLFK
ncbi:holin [Enterococcus nangangensis]|uniref:holin n=1 Tax=Enterococcus nangangensis TaxID=2559926 RepID=UPI0010FA2965|nr:holin [Enterococcus nangangensis]